jgi:hypothetical protein
LGGFGCPPLCGNLAGILESQVKLTNHYYEIGRNCYRKEWEDALKEEFDSLEEIGVFKLVDKPPGRKLMSTKYYVCVKDICNANFSLLKEP